MPEQANCRGNRFQTIRGDPELNRLIRILCFCALLSATAAARAQLSKSIAAKPEETGATLIYLEQCDRLSFDQERLPDAQLLHGNVRFRHDSVLMYCDSAYFYESRNSMDAFGNIRIEQGDTLFVYGDLLFYNGNTKLARLRQNVRMIDHNTTLTTDSLNYDRIQNLAYYFTGGTIRDSLNTLNSVWGQYSPDSKEAFFKQDVRLENPNFIMETDTLIYNTENHIADIVGPTEIIYQEETNIYSTRGWYDTNTEKSMLLDNSLIVHADGKTLRGDTIFYDKKAKFGESFSNVELTDSVQKTTLYGDYCVYDEIKETGLATRKALLTEWSSEDTLFVHADTLATRKDSVYNTMYGYNNVRVFRNDMQSVCDSMFYTDRDSIMSLYYEPIMWSSNNQISADFIQIHMNGNELDHAHLQGSAIAIQQEDSIRFNQLSGKEIIAYFHEKELYKVDVNGNTETVFFPKEDDGTILVINKLISSYAQLFFKDRKIEKAVFAPAASGTTYPLEELPPEETLLGNFFWAEQERPQSKNDVFLKPERTKRPEKGAASAAATETAPAKQNIKTGKTNENNRKTGGIRNARR